MENEMKINRFQEAFLAFVKNDDELKLEFV